MRRSVIVGALSALAATVPAQEVTRAPFVARTPLSIRGLGMGGGWSAARDAGGIFVNPAFAGLGTGWEVGGGWYGRRASNGSAASSLGMGNRGLSLGAAWAEYGAAPGAWNPDASLTTRGTDDAFSLMAEAAGALVFKGVRFGAAAKVVDERVGDDHEHRPSFDVGASKDFGPLSVGLSAQNLGPGVEVRRLSRDQATRVTLGTHGFGLPVGPFDFGLASAVSWWQDGFVSASAGAEFAYTALEGVTVTWRVGARRAPVRTMEPLTTGASFTLDRFTIDYAWEDVSGKGGAHHVGVRVR